MGVNQHDNSILIRITTVEMLLVRLRWTDVSNDLASANLRFTQPLPLRRGHLALTATLEGHGHFLGFSLSLVSCFGFGVEGFRHVGSFGGLQSYLLSADECLWGCSMNVNTLWL